MPYQGGQRSAKRAPTASWTPTFPGANFLFGRGMFAGRGANAAQQPQTQFTPISSDQLPSGAFMSESGRVGGMTSEDAYRLGRVFVPQSLPTITATPTGTQPAAQPDTPEYYGPGEASGPTPIITGLDKSGGVDRKKSDLYKQYAQTPEGQFERYFKTSEMTPYFGNAFQGKGAPTSAQAMIDLASQMAAPTTSPLASYYASQSATGRGSMDEIVQAMGYKGTPMEQWAKANPMLAFREYNKKFPAGQPTMGPTPALPGPPMVAGDTAGERALMEAKYQLSGEPTMDTVDPLAAQAAQQQATADQADKATTVRLPIRNRVQAYLQGGL